MAKMDIFISWSGHRSFAAAEALRGWLRQVVNNFNPWLSSEILKGARWRTEIASKLANATVGIICLTRTNLASPWLLFEAGAISKATENSFACTFLLDGLEPGEIADPLGQFQHTKATKEEILRLVKTLNELLGEDHMPPSHVEKAFEVWWPELDKALKSLPADKAPKLPERDDRELLLESLQLARETNANVRQLTIQTSLDRSPSGFGALYGGGSSFGNRMSPGPQGPTLGGTATTSVQERLNAFYDRGAQGVQGPRAPQTPVIPQEVPKK